MIPKLNVMKLKTDIRAVADEIHALKKETRRPNRIPTWQESSKLGDLKKRATLLCSIQAWRRGRLHLRFKLRQTCVEGFTKFNKVPLTKEDQIKLIGNVFEQYVILPSLIDPLVFLTQ